MTELPDYNKITFPMMPAIPLEKLVPDASTEVHRSTNKYIPSCAVNFFKIRFVLLKAIKLLKMFLVYPSKSRIPASEVSLWPF